MKGNHHGLRQAHRSRRSIGGRPGCGDGGGDHTGHRVCRAVGFGLGVLVNARFCVDDYVLINARFCVDDYVFVDEEVRFNNYVLVNEEVLVDGRFCVDD